MKVIFRFILYIGGFYLLMFILTLFLLPFAIIYDLVDWLMNTPSWRASKRQMIQKIHVAYLKVDDNYSAKHLRGIGHQSKK